MKVKLTTLEVALPDGSFQTRTTNTEKHPYTHVLAVKFDGSAKHRNSWWDGWCAVSWHTSPDLAEKARKTWIPDNGNCGAIEAQVISIYGNLY